MKLTEFIETYLKENAIITVCEGCNILYEGTVKDFKGFNPIGVCLDDFTENKIKNIEGIGSIDDIIIDLEV